MNTVACHPLGPVWLRHRYANQRNARGIAAAIFGAALTLLLLAGFLSPDDRGVGTHEQLGLPPCGLVFVTGIPCPTCGMTTAFSHTIRGQLWSALLAQPFGLLLALSTAMIVYLAADTLITGQGWRLNWYRISVHKVGLVVTALFLLSWAFKIIHHLADNP